jgi:hypothetical protein
VTRIPPRKELGECWRTTDLVGALQTIVAF